MILDAICLENAIYFVDRGNSLCLVIRGVPNSGNSHANAEWDMYP